MQEVTVNTRLLMAKIQANRTAHAKAFTTATEGYRQTVRNLLGKWHNTLNHPMGDPHPDLIGTEPGDPGLYAGAVKEIGQLAAPQSHLEEYDRALAMLQMSVDVTITLQEHEFQQLVMDEWGWKRDFIRSTSAYLGK
jgi:hypothetical protein